MSQFFSKTSWEPYPRRPQSKLNWFGKFRVEASHVSWFRIIVAVFVYVTSQAENFWSALEARGWWGSQPLLHKPRPDCTVFVVGRDGPTPHLTSSLVTNSRPTEQASVLLRLWLSVRTPGGSLAVPTPPCRCWDTILSDWSHG
jgi:hypothetical protein